MNRSCPAAVATVGRSVRKEDGNLTVTVRFAIPSRRPSPDSQPWRARCHLIAQVFDAHVQLADGHLRRRTTQPLPASHFSSVHGFLSSQATALPAVHTPEVQASLLVQALPSSQAALFSLHAQPPVGVQVSVVQGFLSSQLLGPPAGTHTPPPQLEPWLTMPLAHAGAMHTEPSLALLT